MKQQFNQQISTYWWNFGSKKNDFNGSVNDFFKEKGVKYKEVIHPKQPDIKGIEFILNIGSAIIKYKDFSGYKPDSAITAIKLFLTYLGDKAQIKTGSRTINVNH